jgi:hypothetical protein
MAWQAYSKCCYQASVNAESAFCAECGNPLLRCIGFAECSSLVTPTQPCPVCVQPQLFINQGAITQARVGERLSIPMILRNASKVKRPIVVESIVKTEGSSCEPVALPWESINSECERSFTVETAPLPQGGTYTFGVIAMLSSRHKGMEEHYAYAGSLRITVDGQDQHNIINNINLEGATFGTGGMVHAPVSTLATPTAAAQSLRAPEAIPFDRAERFELLQNLRGYADSALRVPRDVAFSFAGFPPNDCPRNGATLGAGGVLICGRNGRRFDAQNNPTPSDLSLRVYDPRTGQIEEGPTFAISRHLFEFLVLNDRLCIQARGGSGVEHNGRLLAPGEMSVVRSGDTLFPLPGRSEKLALKIRFRPVTGLVEEVEIVREPMIRAARA